MKTVPLYGKNARGRVALVSDEDYDRVMRHRWNVWEPAPRTPRHRPEGPYAITNIPINGRQISVRMHTLITGWPLVDHQDHYGLNNQRSNLRPATPGENARNARTRIAPKTSQYKGVAWARSNWAAYIQVDKSRRHLGNFGSELEAAYAYDAAARELHGEFACTNFPEPATQTMLDRWQEERAAAKAALADAARDERIRWWAEREPEALPCANCGAPVQSRAVKRFVYCKECKRRIAQERQNQQRRSRKVAANG
jgi:hypothetical protein